MLISRLIPADHSPSLVKISEQAASILARMAVSNADQNKIVEAGVLPPLISLLDKDQYSRLQEAALDALSALCYNNFNVVSKIAISKSENGTDTVALILSVMRNGSSQLKLHASGW